MLLCLLMVLPVILSGCSDEDDSETAGATSSSSKKAMTVVLYSITNESTTEDAIAAVQDAINEVTEARFNTHVILRLYTADKYFSVIEEKVKQIEERTALEEKLAAAAKAANKAAKAAGVTTTPETTSDETTVETEETLINDIGLEKIVYPTAAEDQMDIFLVSGYERYYEYYQKEVMYALDEELSVNSKLLRDYIYPTFLDAAKMGGKTYAIPNNHMVGEYQFLLLNRELMDKYYYDADDVFSITDIQGYLDTVIKYEPSYIPLVNTPESYTYYAADGQEILGAFITNQALKTAKPTPKILFGVRQYRQFTSFIDSYSQYITESDNVDNLKFAAAIVKGDASLAEKYEDDYYVVLYKSPTFRTADVYESMYAVSTYAKNPSRCMEIITALSTDAQLRNIFQYGVAGVHYEINEDTGLVDILSDDYSMDSIYTGNQFLMWQNSSMSEKELQYSANNWELAKLQNLDSVADPYLGFVILPEPEPDPEEVAKKEAERQKKIDAGEEVPEEVEYMSVEDMLAGLSQLTEEYMQKLKDFVPYENEKGKLITLYEYIDILGDELAENEVVLEALNEDNKYSIISQYNTWRGN